MATGSVLVRDGRIAAVEPGTRVPAGAEDCEGDWLAPGLIELHTDNLERHLEPRPGVRWPEGPAILAHDAELAGTGITTVFDALRVGSLVGSKAGYGKYARPLADAMNRMSMARGRCGCGTGCTSGRRPARRRSWRSSTSSGGTTGSGY